MTNRCEDAPCCGCCGTSLYGSEVSSFEPDYYDEADNLYGDQTFDEDCDGDHECEDCDNKGEEWSCSYCGRPCPKGHHDEPEFDDIPDSFDDPYGDGIYDSYETYLNNS
jgi:hypothetical protein